MSDRFLVHRLIQFVGEQRTPKPLPWRDCDGRERRDGTLEHCPFLVVPFYEHAWATVDPTTIRRVL